MKLLILINVFIILNLAHGNVLTHVSYFINYLTNFKRKFASKKKTLKTSVFFAKFIVLGLN